MNPRVEYEMSEADHETLLEACKPVACMQIGGYSSASPQENVNSAWAVLGKTMGFDPMSVRPSEKGDRFFTAIPSETASQKKERETREAEDSRQVEVEKLQDIIIKSQERLAELSD